MSQEKICVERSLAISVLTSTVLLVVFITAATWFVGYLEFQRAWPQRVRHELPLLFRFFGDVYMYGWLVPLAAALWAGWLLRKPKCGLSTIALYLVSVAERVGVAFCRSKN